MPRVKLKASELRRKSIENLEKMKLELEKRIIKNKRKILLDKYNNIKEDRRSIARINTIIWEKNNEK